MGHFQPTDFRSHPLIRGGHLQTVFSVGRSECTLPATIEHPIRLPDGDSVVLHEDAPSGWKAGDAAIMLVHGLSGCHGSPYMIRLANRFVKMGFRAYRLDMRGCGAAWGLASQLSHAGRSEDVILALGEVAKQTGSGQLHAMGVSLGANQLLRGVGRIGAGLDVTPDWFGRIKSIAAVAPPLDLLRCSDNMERLSRRLYNFYFIRQLLRRVPKLVKQREDFQEFSSGPRPKTLLQLDNRLTAPLSGFASAKEYYESSSACKVIGGVSVKTLVVAAADDPIVPIECFTSDPNQFSASTELLVSAGGGHNGFIGPGSHCWIDDVMTQWFSL